MKRILVSLFVLLCSLNAQAFSYVYVTNMSQLAWQMTPDGKVWLRNLDQFNGIFLSCCYNYWVDTTTPAGKAMWVSMLLKIGGGQPLYLGLTNPAQPGQIEQIGSW